MIIRCSAQMGWKRTLGCALLLQIILLGYARGGGELLPWSESGDGSGVGSSDGSGIVIDPPDCMATSLNITVTVFESIAKSLSQLGCTVEEGKLIVYISSSPKLRLSEFQNSIVFGDYFAYSDDLQTFSLEVCTYDALMDDDACSDETVEVSANINRHSGRLLPFGASFSDSSVTNADDRSVGVFLSRPIPFWNSYYTSVYLSTNGVLSFGRPFTQWWPVAFPYGWSTVPVIAPYWNDLDFRNDVAGSGLYYHTYTKSSSKRDEAFLREFSDRLDTYTDGDSFDPDWMIVVTWYKATPFYGKSNNDETLTFQLLLASDSVDTYAVFLYEKDGIIWNRESRDIVIGYDAKNYISYLNVDGSKNFIEIDTLTGNTDSEGEWYFQLTDGDDDTNYERECVKWANRQKKNVFEEYFEGLPVCPCTRQQAWRDWRFWFGWRWGLSSAPNCATLVWSGRQSTTECCYDDSGALLVGKSAGGSYKLHHPWFSNRDYITEDKQPYVYCCQLSDHCSMFYTHRPSDDCTGYDASQISFNWGDPHFQTVDGETYTFNGLGEYILLQSTENDMKVQVRLTQVETLTDFIGTVISAVVVTQGSAQPIQVEQSSGGLALFVNGTSTSLPVEDESILIVTEEVVYTSFESFVMSEQNYSTADFVSLRFNDDNLIISLSSGASVMVSTISSVLHLAVEVSDAFINSTEGLLGYFNGDSSDDFYKPDGTSLSIDASEIELFEYGKEWHITEMESLFEYFNGESYSTYNDEWDTHTPTFTDELSGAMDGLSDLEATCGGDPECQFDYAVTNNASFATATHTVASDNQDTQEILNNHAPVITGPTEVYVTTGETFTESYSAEDEDSHDITAFKLKAPEPDGISLEVESDGVTAQLVWSDPDSELPSSAIQILVNDSMGATAVRNISVVLCACANDGRCINSTTLQCNSNGHYLQECECPDFFSGDLCETDERSCSDSSCPESSQCETNSSVPAGYTCSACQEGYELDEDGKCTDINECNTTNSQYEHGCAHTCVNTEGSYECRCMDGYALDEDDRNCTDIDECYEGTDDCGIARLCTNTEGSFSCSCHFPEKESADGKSCTTENCAGAMGDPCDSPSDCAASDSSGMLVCICEQYGTYCQGDCTGDDATLRAGTQSCSACETNMYGYRCKKVCDCSANGRCVAASGCTCDAGYTGAHCETEINTDAPEFSEDTIKELTLSQNLPEGAVLAQFNATDNDTGAPGEVVFSLSHADQLPVNISSGEDIFSINSTTGILVLEKDLNTTRGLYTRFVLTVVATDSGEDPQSSEVIIPVLLEDTPAPIPSFDEGVYTIKVSEATTDNSTVLNFTCSEPKGATGTSNLTTALIQSNDSTLFSLEGEYDDLMLVLLEEIDYEGLTNTTTPHFTLEVTCSNQYEISTSARIKIEIRNINDSAFEFDNSTYNVSVPENVQRYYQVLNVTAFDPDVPDDEISYDSTNPGIFNIFPNGTVYVSEPDVNREEKDEYNLTLEAKVTSNGEVTKAILYIVIIDINELAPSFDNDLYISDNLTTANTLGDVALTVTAVDDDFGKNGSIVYSLEENDLFAINRSTGEIYINSSDVVSLYGSYVLHVYARDEGDPPLSSTSRVDIYVAPIPDRIVFRNLTSLISITEDEPRGSEITSILAEVVDRINGTIIDAETIGDVEYELVATNDSEKFHLGRYSGELILLSSLDFEVQTSYVLDIRVSIPTYSQDVNESATIQVNLIDVNDNTPEFSPTFYAKVVEEFTETGTSVLTVNANDRDSGVNGDVTYRIADGESVPFSIDSVSGELRINAALDTPLDYRFYVVAEDGGVPKRSSEAVAFISVIRSASVVPEFNRHIYKFTVPENSQVGTEIGSVLAQVTGNISVVEYAHLQYRIQMPDIDMNGTMFHIDSDLGNVSVLVEFDTEEQSFFAFYVEVYNSTDDTQVFDTATVEVLVLDVNDNAPVFDQSLYTHVITTAQPPRSILFAVSAKDRDADTVNSQIEYDIESNTLGFEINSTSGEIFPVNSTSLVGDYHMTAVARDTGDPVETGTATVFISVIPAGPQDILFEENEYEFDISEDALPATLLGTIVAVDHNNMAFIDSSNLRYYFSSNSSVIDSVCLNVGEFNGEVQVSCTLDRERESSYSLVVVAEYEGNQTGEVRMTVNVLDVNDNHPEFTKDIYATVVVTSHGNSTVVLKVSAEDRDSGMNGIVRYTFDNGMTESNLFRIDSTSGEIYFLDEVIPADDYRLTITASDSGTPTPETATAVVFICVIYEEPIGALQIISTSFSIDENSPTGAVVGTVQLQAGGTDIVPEIYQGNLQFSIIGGDSEDLFVINPDNGTLKVIGFLDHEEATTHVVEVEAVFNEYSSISANSSLIINVGDLNDNSPTFSPSIISTIIDDGYMYNETLPNTQLYASDGDSGTNAELEFYLDEINPFGVRVTGSSARELRGEIYVRNVSLLEPGESYSFAVFATDKADDPLTSSAIVYIVVRYVVPEVISFPFSEYTFNHTENSAIDTTIGSVSVEQDTPALNDLVYSVSGGTGRTKFHVEPYSGDIYNLVFLDREADTEFSLNITAQLPNAPDLQATTTSVTIIILDENDNTPVFDRSSYSTPVFTDDIMTDVPLINVSASDRDLGLNAQIFYNITTFDDLFSVNQNGNIFAKSDSLPVGTYQIYVEARDMGVEPLTGTAAVIIDVRQSVPESISFDQSQYSFTISEYNISGTVVGRVVLDPPLPNDFVQYHSFSSNSTDFLVVPQSGTVQSLRQFDHEAFPDDDVVIEFVATCILDLPQESPPVRLTATASVRVVIRDENDNTPRFTNIPQTLQHVENVSMEAMIAQITAEDDDAGSNAELLFEVANDQNEVHFRIDPITGQLFVKPGLDREQQETYIISILVKDQGDPQRSYHSDIVFTLMDINDNIPVLVQTEFAVEERVTGNVFQLTYRDSDEGDYARATFTRITNQGDSRFTVDTNSGIVALVDSLDYEIEPTVNFVVELADSPNDLSVANRPQYTITVNVIDKPDNVPVFDEPAGYTVYIDPSIETDQSLVQVHASDDDGDTITYSIENTEADFVDINSGTGELSVTTNMELQTESVYIIDVKATDNSEYGLSSITTVTIIVSARLLAFEQDSYAASVAEDAPIDYRINKARIDILSQSSNLEYSYEIISPDGADDPFRKRSFLYFIDILVDGVLDREAVSSYTLALTASRPSDTAPGGIESVTVELVITVEDVNDNAPVIDPPNLSYTISEDASISDPVVQVTATDRDLGENGELAYSIIDPSGSPFRVDSNGAITVRQLLDFETDDSYNLTIQVADLGNPVMSSTERYFIQIENVNDNAPTFSAPAYFGELNSDAPNNIAIHHVILSVGDVDGDKEFTFTIEDDSEAPQASNFELRVSNQPPYYVIATTIPDGVGSGLYKFEIEVSDGLHTATTILYLGVYSPNHLLTLTLSGVSKDEFLSCSDSKTSVCDFLDSLSAAATAELGQPVSYYNDSVQESDTDITQLIVSVYGWYGNRGPRENNGEEQTSAATASVIYITYTEEQVMGLAARVAGLHEFDFDIELGEVTDVTPSTEPGSQGVFQDRIIVGIVSAAAVSVLLIILVIVMVGIFGRRRKPKKKDRDPYDLSYSRRHRRNDKSIPLTPKAASSDLAYETMYDDDEILHQPQTIPWFDPNYLAPNEAEGYEGDAEQMSSRKATPVGNPLRATVDGDARRLRRRSSDESPGGGSVTELDPSNYLGAYQKSTPMQPGQQMGEYDMFVNPNARDSDKPYRPSLQSMPGYGRGQKKSTTS